MKKTLISIILSTSLVISLFAQVGVKQETIGKADSVTLNTARKGWDGSIKGASKKGITQSGIKKLDNAQTENPLRKGWDGTVKGGKVQSVFDGSNNRISMNVTVPKQTQGATFGEKVNAGRINITVVADGCIVLFPNTGFRVNTKSKIIQEMTAQEHATFGEKVNAGLHAAGGALAQGASLLGGALPGGAIISAAVSSVSTMAGGAGGGAAAAAYARKSTEPKKTIWDSRDDDCDGLMNLPDGDYELVFIVNNMGGPNRNDALKSEVKIAFTSVSNVLKTKHDTVKNSINNVR